MTVCDCYRRTGLSLILVALSLLSTACVTKSIVVKKHEAVGTLKSSSGSEIHFKGCHSLTEVQNDVSEVFSLPIREAMSAIAPEEDVENICFKPLLAGLSASKLFRVDIKDKSYVLRLLNERKPIERRKSELNAHKIGAKLKIAPELIFADQLPLVMVMKFIEGRTFSRDDLDNKEITTKVMQTVKKFHRYSGEESLIRRTKVGAIQDIYDRYRKRGARYPSGFDQLHRKLQEHFAKLKTKYQPSHGDLNPRNILITKDGNIYLIDWAEAAFDNPFLDIGWLSCFSAASHDQIKNLLRNYLKRDPKESEIGETLFFRDAAIFLVATLWIGRQEERDQNKLDAILKGPLKKASEYIKEGITPEEIKRMKGLDKTLYALGWLKDYIVNQKM